MDDLINSRNIFIRNGSNKDGRAYVDAEFEAFNNIIKECEIGIVRSIWKFNNA